MQISQLGFCHPIFMHVHKNYEIITNLAQSPPYFLQVPAKIRNCLLIPFYQKKAAL